MTLMAASILTGCLDEHSGAEDVWADVRCREQNGATLCIGMPDGTNTWLHVVSDRQLEDSNLEPAPIAWGAGSCDADGAPLTWAPETRCYTGEGSNTHCYAGGQGWYASTVETCSLSEGQADAWPASSCGAEDQPSGWDSLTCGAGDYPTCVAVSGNAAFLAYPECWGDAWDGLADR